MEKIHEIRHKNARKLLIDSGLKIKEFAEQYGASQGYASKILGDNPSKTIGEKVARKLEVFFGQPPGSLDVLKIPAYDISVYEDIEEVNGDVHARIPLYEIELSAGHGRQSPEFVETLYELPFRLDWIAGEGVNPVNVKIMRVKGDSMMTTLGDGDKVLLDISDRAKTIENNRVYAVVMADELFVKRLVKTYNGGLEVISDNDDYEKITIPPEDVGYIHIIGRVFHKMGNSGL